MEIKELTCSEIKELRDNEREFLIIQGCGGDLSEWVNGITDILKDEGVIKNDSFSFDEIYKFQNDKLTNLVFSLDSKDIDISRLAIVRLQLRRDFGAMWLSDYIDNGYIKDMEFNI